MNPIHARWAIHPDGIAVEGSGTLVAATNPILTPEQAQAVCEKVVVTHNELVDLLDQHANHLFNEGVLIKMEPKSISH